MKLGIVGLPNVGKSTLFNAITKAGADSANYPFCTVEPNIGVVSVLDTRLDFLETLYKSKSKVFTNIEFFDIAGLVKGASKGEGLGNKFLANIREVAAIVHVVRCFDGGDIVHVEGSINPVRDVQTIELELILSDLLVVEKQLNKTGKLVKSDKTQKIKLDLLTKVFDLLNLGNSLRRIDFAKSEIELIKPLNLLSIKPIIYVANVGEEDILSGNEYVKELQKFLKDDQVVIISAEIENEIAQLKSNEKKEFLEDLGLKKSGLTKLVKKSYNILNLVSFLTAGEKEVRAWTIKKGSVAPIAAGKIHSDIQRGFIRAEVVSFDDLKNSGNFAKAKSNGKVRLEGKNYVVLDGDIINFRFNV